MQDIDAVNGTRLAPLTILLLGGALVGTLDAVYATLFSAARGIAPERVWQYVASGVQGPAAFHGGVNSVVLGLACHYFIATCMVVVYYVLARQWHLLAQYPWRFGSAYGLALYAVMNYVVVPLSAVPSRTPRPIDWLAVGTGIAVHVVLVGVP